MLRIEHLTKKYGDKIAVDDVNLHIQQGEIYGFIGHNGAGNACIGSGDIFTDVAFDIKKFLTGSNIQHLQEK